jgi:hypothetical protein
MVMTERNRCLLFRSIQSINAGEGMDFVGAPADRTLVSTRYTV